MRYISLRLSLLLLLALRALPVFAQEVRGTVRDSVTRQPVPGAVVMLLDDAGVVGARTLTNQRGAYRMALSATMRRVRVVRLGFRPAVRLVPAPDNGVVTLDLVIVSIPVTLQSLQTVAAQSCPQRDDAGAALALLDQARSGLLTTVVSRAVQPARMKRLLFDRHMDGNSDRITHQSVRIDSAVTTGSFGAVRTASDFVKAGFVLDSGGVRTFFAPDAETLLDDGFASGYCFRLMDADRSRPRQIGLGFHASDRPHDRIDIDGALWIDTVARTLIDVEFHYVGLDRAYEAFHPGGRVSFQSMPNGVVLVDRWSLRLVGAHEDTISVMVRRLESQQRAVSRYYAQEVGGELARAEWDDGSGWSGALGTLRVHATTADGLPARRSILALGDTRYVAAADSAGVVEITDLLPGPYDLYVVDPVLSPLGISLPTGMSFTATRDSIVSMPLTVPTAEEYAAQACGGEKGVLGTAWILGRLTTADGHPVEGATWVLQHFIDGVGWVNIVQGGVTGTDGVFRYCRLAIGTIVRVLAQLPGAADASHVQGLTQRLTIITLEMKPVR